MIGFQVGLSHCEVAPRADALLLRGSEASDFIRQICEIGLADGDVRCYPVAASRSDCQLIALFIELAEPQPCDRFPPQISTLRRLENRLYCPTSGELEPALNARDVNSLCQGRIQVIDPTFGVFGFEDGDGFLLSELLTIHDRILGPALPLELGRLPPPRLLGVTVDIPEPETVLDEEARGEIGEEEPPKHIQRIIDREAKRHAMRDTASFKDSGLLERILARTTLFVTDRIPSDAPKRTLWNVLEDWALLRIRRPMGDYDAGTATLHWLIQKLMDDPDQGLRYAIPIHDSDSRGKSDGQLILRDHDLYFSLSRYMDVDSDTRALFIDLQSQQQLDRIYRTLATQALQDGNSDRAAYILAELLDDPRAAAGALEQVGRYSDAASLYQHKCKDKAAAAECLVRGGQLNEATVLYLEMREHREAAHLLRKIGQEEEARKNFEKAYTAARRSDNYLEAADIKDADLGQTEVAMETLLDGYSKGHSSAHCLKHWFTLVGKRGDRERALGFLKSIPEDLERHRAAELLRVLVDQARTFSDGVVAAAAADRSLVLAGHTLSRQGSAGAACHEILDILTTLDTGDGLFRRDLAHARRTISAQADSNVLTTQHGGLSVIDQFDLRQTQVLASACASDGVLLLLRDGNDIKLYSLGKQGLQIEALWRPETKAVCAPHAWLIAEARIADPIVVHFAGESLRLPMRERMGKASVGTPPGMPDCAIAVCQGESSSVLSALSVSEQGDVSHMSLGFDGRCYSTKTVDDSRLFDLAYVPTVSWDGDLAVAVEDGVGRFRSVTRSANTAGFGSLRPGLWTQDPAGPIGRIACGPHGALFTSTTGGCSYFATRSETSRPRYMTSFAEEHVYPHVLPFGENRILVASQGLIDLYLYSRDALHHIRKFDKIGNDRILGLLSGPRKNQAYLLCGDAAGSVALRLCRFV